MPEIGKVELIMVAAPAVRSGARWLAQRIGLGYQDREDLEQELWLHLLLWWRDGGRAAIHDCRRTPSRAQVRRRVWRLSYIFARSRAFRRRFNPHRERSSSRWLDGDAPSKHSANAQRLCELQLDVDTALTHLSDELRNPCERLLSGASARPKFGSGNTSDYRAAVALRRVFVMHDLHNYL